jgi:hypothetical protein
MFIGGQAGEDIDLQDVLVPEIVFPILSEDSEALKVSKSSTPSAFFFFFFFFFFLFFFFVCLFVCFFERLQELFSHLPPGTQNLAGLRELLYLL